MLTLSVIKENPEEVIRRLAIKHFDGKEAINRVLELDKIPMALEVVNQFIKSNSNKELGKLKTMLDCVIGENIMPEYID